MNASVKKRLIALGLLWGLAFAVLPAFFAFDDPFTLSPFLVSAFACSALAGAAGAILAGGWVSGRAARVESPGVFAALLAGAFAGAFAGVLHGLVFSVLASLSIWVCLAVNISGFSTATPGNILNLASNPGIFEMSGIAARAVFLYSLAVGLVLSPISGSLVLWVARMGGGKLAEAG